MGDRSVTKSVTTGKKCHRKDGETVRKKEEESIYDLREEIKRLEIMKEKHATKLEKKRSAIDERETMLKKAEKQLLQGKSHLDFRSVFKMTKS